jgi:hypothetical protein
VGEHAVIVSENANEIIDEMVGDSGHKCAFHELTDVLCRALQEPIKGEEKIKGKEYRDDFEPDAT